MITECPECGGTVSDKAVSCPHCGFPLKTQAIKVEKQPQQNKRKHIKLPNGYGSIRKLTGKRRNPYGAYEPVRKEMYDENGKAECPKALGYFKTYNEALECLANYNRTHGSSVSGSPSFKEVYEKWFQHKFGDILPSQNSSAACHQSAFRRCESLHNMPIDRIYKDEMQNVIDSCQLGYSSLMNIKKLFNAVFRYSYENGLIEKNYAEYVHVNKGNDNEHGVPLTMDEITQIWSHKDEPVAQVILIFIYSGMRITELQKTTIDLENEMFIGGIKTTAGKERIIPFHNSIIPFIRNFTQNAFKPKIWREQEFYPFMEKIGLKVANRGEKRTPHDLRHTFSWLADTYGMDQLSKHLIMGHDLGSDTEVNTYGHRTVEQLRTEINRIQTPQL